MCALVDSGLSICNLLYLSYLREQLHPTTVTKIEKVFQCQDYV